MSSTPWGGGATVDVAIASAYDTMGRVRAEIVKAVVGQDDVVDQVLAGFLASGHVLLEGVPGLGKTLLVLALARTFGGQFARVQFTPDLMPSDVTGHAVLDVRSGEFRIRRGPAFTNLLLADEVNRAPAKTQAALLEVMQEGQITIEGKSFALAPPFMTFATQNPIELEGTYPLPEAQLDRFLLKVKIEYPGADEERRIVDAVTNGRSADALDVSAVAPVASVEEILAAQRAAAAVTVDARVRDYAVDIVRATRSWPGLAIGAGPRGAIALVRAARSGALLAGRDFTTPDDVKDFALPVLRHRVVLSADLEMEGQKADDVLRALVDTIETPRS